MIRTPLRYPGGKFRAAKIIASYIPDNEKVLCSPFLGAASVELLCTDRMTIYGSDVFEPLTNFWNMLLYNPKLLSKQIEKYYPLSRDRFYFLQQTYIHIRNDLEKAAVFFVLNRSSFNGSTFCGGMSLGHVRFTKTSIAYVSNFHVNNFKVEYLDYKDCLDKYKDTFMYLDPPYAIQNYLYGYKGDLHKKFDHEELYRKISKRDNWIMSYNNCDMIRKLYKKHTIVELEWHYGMNKNKQSSEILIFSLDR